MTASASSGAWLERDALDVAPELLGALLTTRLGAGRVTARITEVEAYRGAHDPGSHAYRGRSVRNAAMFGPAAHLYVYRHLGLHHCMNVVCGPEGEASAVLLRAAEIVEGRDLARARRTAAGVARTDRDLARGPGNFTVALGIDLGHDGARLTGGELVLVPRDRPLGATILSGPRVGVSGEGGDPALFPWRFWIEGEPTVSAYRRSR
ncbi:DNA-3-methyladenine glycosylase [Paraoerskovia marina]|uniref:Putative 3-methyladenine DNA glycosylase n=1 Tax=Paraoerskovia marina TaxID=545619 RepID=A0A1H1TJ36_9CELL|nr:DNA-3-methyladenine glycosylase [Paraoerskovia marina]SDS60263.1 DNA-3-methyladenine glycosylase [Paraoerskovia marina]